jgi:erythromycin esterase-like protein
VKGWGHDADASDALGDFRRFPAWMWRNADVLDFVGWLRSHDDDGTTGAEKVGFYGLDLYSLHASIEAVLAYLDRRDPESAELARQRYACFEQFGGDPQRYGLAATRALTPGCEDEVVAQLLELQARRGAMLGSDGTFAEEDYFQAEQNARVVTNAEEYYRSMFGSDVSSWNLRDTHMMDTLDALSAHLATRIEEPRIVVWAHNSHIGDARATEMGAVGEINLGQLCRMRHPFETVLIGFSTYTGTVTAASDWGGPAERKRVLPALAGSYEHLFHETEVPGFFLPLGETDGDDGVLREPRLQRAIGVVYRPRTERASHYYEVRLPDQLDAIFHLDETRALEPLERTSDWRPDEAPETYPSGM